MKIQCINTIGLYSKLTFNAVYEVINENDRFYYIVGNDGRYAGYSKYQFQELIDKENNEMQENRFWIVAKDEPRTYVTIRHTNYKSAETEAKRLARYTPGTKFIVLQSVSAFQVNNLQEIEYVDSSEPPEIPF